MQGALHISAFQKRDMPASGLSFCDDASSGTAQHLEHLAAKIVSMLIGLWLNIPDYDAPTQMVKPHERNTRYVDAVMTIPKVCIRGSLLLLLYSTQSALP